MASSKEYLDYILDCLSGLDEITTRKMMGEYMIYFRSKLVGGIYDIKFLVKDFSSAQRLMPDAPRELPYEGAKPMLLVENAEDRTFISQLFDTLYSELPAPKQRKKKQMLLYAISN